MNNPPYILVDVFSEVVNQVTVAMHDKGILNPAITINYQYGYITELKETLAQFSKTEEYSSKKYPLIWLRQPFTITRNTPSGLYGSVDDLIILIVNGSEKSVKASKRMENNFKPIIYPIYQELQAQLNNHPAISYDPLRPHRETDRYFWQSPEIDDVIDCLEISGVSFAINNNPNCIPTKSF